MKIETEIADEQAGFRQGRGTREPDHESKNARQASISNYFICASWTSRRRLTLSLMIRR